MALVAVYGTLKKGEANHRLLENRSFFVNTDFVLGTLYDLGPYPAATSEVFMSDEVKGQISVEIYEVGPKTLKDLDRLEGHPVYYVRRPVRTLIGNHEVWVYFMPSVPEKATLVPSGVWSKASARKGAVSPS